MHRQGETNTAPARDRRRVVGTAGTRAPARLGSCVLPALWALALAAIIAAAGALPALARGALAPTGSSTGVRVAPADTLWSIAAAHPLPGRTTAETADEIRTANHLAGARLRPGAVLLVPVQEAPPTSLAQAARARVATP
jgi:hypothetical protein